MSLITSGTDLNNLIKILNITEEGRGGGALHRIVDIANALEQKVKFVVVGPKEADNLQTALKEKGVEYLGIAIRPLSRHWLYFLRYLFFFIPEIISLYRIINRESPDIVYCNGSWQIKGIIASKFAGKLSIWHMNDVYQPSTVRWFFKIFSRWCDHFLFASHATKDYYFGLIHKIDQKRWFVIPAPVDTHLFSYKASRTYALDVYIGKKVITTGYINSNKDLSLFINVARKCQSLRQGEDLHFFILGPVLDSQKSYKASLDKMIQRYQVKNVHFIGYQADVASYLRASDLYLCTSQRESSPIAVWEALACGLPVISTDVGDVKKIFDTYECGVVVPIGNVDIMASEIIKFLDKPLDECLKENARTASEDLFSIDKVSRAHFDFYQATLER